MSLNRSQQNSQNVLNASVPVLLIHCFQMATGNDLYMLHFSGWHPPFPLLSLLDHQPGIWKRINLKYITNLLIYRIFNSMKLKPSLLSHHTLFYNQNVTIDPDFIGQGTADLGFVGKNTNVEVKIHIPEKCSRIIYVQTEGNFL